MLTIACVKAGTKYDLIWVDKLYNAVVRNIQLEFEFVCLSDADTDYRTIPLISNSDSYWNKLELFRPNLFNGPVLYFDLDVVICKDITNVVAQLPDKFLMVQEPYRNINNSSMMYWNGNYSYLYNNYINKQQEIINEYQFNLNRTGCLGDQAYISEHVKHDLFENVLGNNFVSWCHHKINAPVTDPSVLIFTGNQKPNNNLDLPLVKTHWI